MNLLELFSFHLIFGMIAVGTFEKIKNGFGHFEIIIKNNLKILFMSFKILVLKI